MSGKLAKQRLNPGERPVASTQFPDPSLTASLYCNRRLELMAREVLGGLSADLDEQGLSSDSFFWYLRYGKCGEHLKVRVHGPDSAVTAARQSLAAHASRFFATSASNPEPQVWVSKSAIPPLDTEDEQEADYPNKTLLWTHYRRSPVVFGSEVYLDDEIHLVRFCRCQAAVTRLALDILLPKLGELRYPEHRQAIFLHILLTALSSFHLPLAETAAYLAYHRDWLIRSLVHNVTTPETTTFETLRDELRIRAESSASTLRPLAEHIEAALEQPQASTDDYLPLHREFSAFYDHVSTYRGQSRYDQDPCTRDFSFLPVFKVLHFAANQLGFRLSHEAYVFTLLLRATEHLCPRLAMADIAGASSPCEVNIRK
jgi:hypothetical protein